MSLIDFTHKSLVKGVNAANALTLDLNDVAFSLPKENTSSYLAGGTLVRMVGRDHLDVDGSTVLSYDRVPLSALRAILGGKLVVPASVTTANEMVPYFHYSHGIGISQQDLTAAIVPGLRTFEIQKLTSTGFKHSASATVNENAVPAEQAGWYYDSNLNTLRQTIDSTQVNGFISQESFSNYVLDMTLSSTSFDTGLMGVVLGAYYDTDLSQMQTLSVDINLTGVGGVPAISFNTGESGASQHSTFGSSVGTVDWATAGSRRIVATRTGDSIKIDVYGFSIVQNPANIVATKTIDLTSDVRFAPFLTQSRIGFLTKNCLNAKFGAFSLQYTEGLQLLLTALPDNAYFFGNARFDFTGTGEENTGVTYNYTPTPFIKDSGKAMAETYKWPLNLTTYTTTMAAITINTTDFKALVTALRVITGNDWKQTGVSEYSLSRAIVRKVGLVQAAWGVNMTYKYACIIELSSDCTALEGNLIIHFN